MALAFPSTWLLTAALLLVAGPAAAVEMGPHAGSPCSGCHVTDSAGQPVGLIDDQQSTCQRCHAGDADPHSSDHPVFVAPKTPIPADLPLDAQGRLTCSTCHIIHVATPSLLRTGATWSCRNCHAL